MTGFDVAARRFHVTGRVQGVGYRAFAARTGRALGLSGGASNRDDGSVDVLARGPEHALERFASALTEGPRLARVDGVEVRPLDVARFDASGEDVEF